MPLPPGASVTRRWVELPDGRNLLYDSGRLGSPLAGVRPVSSVLWSRGITPVSGKHRLRPLELNGRVSVAGMAVQPGDLVLADSTGVCVVPAASADPVLARCRELEVAEQAIERAMDSDATPEEIARSLRPDRW